MFHRLYHVSAITFSLKKQGSKLCKMINPKGKKQWYPAQSFELDTMPSMKSLTKTNDEPGKRAVRRIAVLNKIFMKHITDIMSTGTVSLDIVGRGIEISKVAVSQDFKTLKVFWVCKGDSSDDVTEKLLNKIAGILRHELSTLRVMGEVAYIVFVKDMFESRIVDLDRRLRSADYGEDYTPTEIGHLLKSEFTLDTQLSPEVKAKIKRLEDETPGVDEPLPEMTHAVYGLDHAKIMNRLLAARKKSRDAWSSLSEDSNVITYRTPNTKAVDVNTGNAKQELAEFLHKRQILHNKLRKQMLDSRANLQVALNEQEDDLVSNDDDVNDDDDDDDDDYYDEDSIQDSRLEEDYKK